MYSLSLKLTRGYDHPSTGQDAQKLRGRRASWISKALSRKASPTVSLVNTNASCHTTSNNSSTATVLLPQQPNSSIPFPSASIPVPSYKSPNRTSHHLFAPYTLDDLEHLQTDEKPHEKPPSAGPPWHIQLHRHRSQSCLVQTYFHDENKPVEATQPPVRTRKDRPRDRAVSDSVPPGIVKPKPAIITRPKPRKASRKAQAEMHFLAAVYRSIKRFVESRDASAGALDTQDKLFLARLHQSLLLQGCQLALLTVSTSPDPALPPVSLDDLGPPSSPVLSYTPPNMMPEVLTPPQVVASLILRHRDRSAVRPRSSSPAGRVAKGNSPLRNGVVY